jgi:L-arginine dehydrogenase
MYRTASPIILTARDVEALVNRLDALEIMRAAFRSLGAATAIQPPQLLTLLPSDAGDFITYLGVLADAKVFGTKISPYLVREGAAHVTAWTLLLSMETGLPILLCDSKQLTTERTAATTALAVELLAPKAASRLAVIGMGPIAQAHVRHVRGLRPWEDIRVYSRRLEKDSILQESITAMDSRAQLEPNLNRAIDGADVLLLCTSSSNPVIDPLNLRNSALITSISTNAPNAHEVPPASLTHMDVYCDYRQTTPSAAAEMRLAAAEHRWSPKSVAGDLPELATGQAILPSYDRPVFFRSMGLGLEDIAMAHALFKLVKTGGEARTG